MIRPYLRDLINEHKPTAEWNNANNTNNGNNSNNINNTIRAEWKIQLVVQNNFISNKHFEDTPTIYSASKPVETFMGSGIENAIDTLFNTILDGIQQATETSKKEEADLFMKVLLYCIIIFKKIDIRRGESYIMSTDWIVSKKATITPKNEKDNECFKWPIIGGLNYNKINEKELKKKRKRVDLDFANAHQLLLTNRQIEKMQEYIKNY